MSTLLLIEPHLAFAVMASEAFSWSATSVRASQQCFKEATQQLDSGSLQGSVRACKGIEDCRD